MWGSCGRGVNVHWRTILLPPRYIDYILAHELVHLCEPRHNKRFWAALERVMPDFAERKQWLAEQGGRFRGPGHITMRQGFIGRHAYDR
jgi:predicted metal-dependent hydrolase